MAARAKSLRVGRFGGWPAARIAAILLLGATPASPQTPLTLDQAASRKGADYAPAFAGEVVLVHGAVASAPVGLLFYDHIAIQDESGHGLVLESAPGRLASFRPGDVLDARGTIAPRAGLPVVMVSAIRLISHGTPPIPRRVSPGELNSFGYLGSVVATDGRVIAKGENTGGEYLFIGDRAHPLQVFLPRKGRDSGAGVNRFEIGDKVRAVGISSQYCPSPPYNGRFQLLVADPADMVLLVKRWPVSPEFFFTALLALGSVLGAWWVRERRMSAQRATAMALATLGEDLIGAENTPEVVNRLAKVLPAALRVSHVRLYLYSRASLTLDPVEMGEPAEPIPVNSPETAPIPASVACFRNRALLAIPRTRRSPFYGRKKAGAPRSVLLIPMCAQSELLGVLEIGHNRRLRAFTPDEQVAAQHLANQVAISIKLMEQQSMRQRLYRSEKLAAAGQLISGIAGEVRTPLERIVEIAGAGNTSSATDARLKAVHREAYRAAEILDRVVAFARSEPGEEKTLDLNALLRGLAAFRLSKWGTDGTAFEDRLGPSPLWILADPGQIERAFLDLLLEAERALADAPGRRIVLATSMLAGRALVELEYGSAEPVAAPAEASQEWVFRHAFSSCGGELRLMAAGETGFRMEVELPLAGSAAGQAATPAEWSFTVLVVDPDPAARRDLLDLLTLRGCRVVPAVAAEQGADLSSRMRFDVIFCSVRLPGLSWVDLLERVRGQAGAFVLLTEGLARPLPAGDELTLPKPVREADLDRILAKVDAQQPYPQHSATQ